MTTKTIYILSRGITPELMLQKRGLITKSGWFTARYLKILRQTPSMYNHIKRYLG